MAAIIFDHATKTFGDFKAVNDFSLTIEDGEFLVIVGPSGSGKSTVLRMLAGLEEVDEGDISIGDRVVTEVQAKDRDLAMVFQSYALYPHMTVFDNMAFGLKLRKIDKEKINRLVHEAAGILDIEELLKRKPGQLSGGQRQRVALGRAIVREPAAFLLDEPLSNLDAKLRVQTRAELGKLHQRLGATFVYVTHDQVEAMTMASRIAVMDQGILQQVGTPRKLYETPANLFVASFIGSPGMNFFDVTVLSDSGAVRLDAGPFSLVPMENLARRLTAYNGQTITVGIRPEDIHDPEFPRPGITPAEIEVDVDVVEPMGSETVIHLLVDDLTIVARADSRTSARAGQGLHVALDLTHLHAFDIETGLAIDSEAPANPQTT